MSRDHFWQSTSRDTNVVSALSPSSSDKAVLEIRQVVKMGVLIVALNQ